MRTLLSYIPQNSADGTAYSSSNDEINRLVDVDSIISADKYSMADVIGAVSDDAKFLELGAEYAKSMLTGFVTLNGMVAGVVANQPAVDGGKITADAAKKAARFVSFCDCFDIPVLTLVDTEGYEVSAEAEKANYGAALAKLASAYAASENAKVTVVLGRLTARLTPSWARSRSARIFLSLLTARRSALCPPQARSLSLGTTRSPTTPREARSRLSGIPSWRLRSPRLRQGRSTT